MTGLSHNLLPRPEAVCYGGERNSLVRSGNEQECNRPKYRGHTNVRHPNRKCAASRKPRARSMRVTPAVILWVMVKRGFIRLPPGLRLRAARLPAGGGCQ